MPTYSSHTSPTISSKCPCGWDRFARLRLLWTNSWRLVLTREPQRCFKFKVQPVHFCICRFPHKANTTLNTSYHTGYVRTTGVLEVLVQNQKESRSKYTHHLPFRNEGNVKELADVTTRTETLKTEGGMQMKYIKCSSNEKQPYFLISVITFKYRTTTPIVRATS